MYVYVLLSSNSLELMSFYYIPELAWKLIPHGALNVCSTKKSALDAHKKTVECLAWFFYVQTLILYTRDLKDINACLICHLVWQIIFQQLKAARDRVNENFMDDLCWAVTCFLFLSNIIRWLRSNSSELYHG